MQDLLDAPRLTWCKCYIKAHVRLKQPLGTDAVLASYNLRSCIIVLNALYQKQIVAILHRISQQKALLLLAFEPSPIWSMTCSTSAGSRLVMAAELDTPGAKLHRNVSLVTSRNRNCSDVSIAFFRKRAARSGVEPKSNLSSA